MYNVMVVEDEFLVRTGIKESLASSSLPLRLSDLMTDGLKAYEEIIKSPPDILITDLRLPGIDGMELIRRTREAGCNCKILVISCLEDFETQQKAMTFQISGYLFKATMTAQELNSAMKHIVQELEPLPEKDISRPEIKRVLEYINDHLDEPLHLQAMADIAGFSANYFSNLFTSECGISYVAYLSHVRLERARELLLGLNMPVQEVAIACGFKDESYFRRCFKAKYGLSPGKWRRKHTK